MDGDDDENHNDTQVIAEETTDTEIFRELDDEEVTAGADTTAGPSIIQDVNSSAEGTDKKTLENIDDALYRRSLRTALGSEGTPESHTQDGDAKMMEVRNGRVLARKAKRV